MAAGRSHEVSGWRTKDSVTHTLQMAAYQSFLFPSLMKTTQRDLVEHSRGFLLQLEKNVISDMKLKRKINLREKIQIAMKS